MNPMLVLLLTLLLLLLWGAVPAARSGPMAPVRIPRARQAVDVLDVARLVERLATVIGAGVPPRRAWDAIAEASPSPALARWALRIATGADPRRAAPRGLAEMPAVDSLAAALAVCERTGAPTATVLRSLAQALRDLHDAAQARRSAFAGPRSTARILLVLPLAGLGLGMLLGSDPLALLLGTALGHALTAIGIALTAIGWLWMRRLLRRADPPPAPGVDPSVLLELIAGALSTGLGLPMACRAVADALPEHAVSADLDRFAQALLAGVSAREAARALPAHLAPLVESAQLAAASGADLSGVLRSAAEDSRRGRARAAEVRAAQLGVRLVLPTGLALLPAFVALGIVPTVFALLGGATGSGSLL